MDYKKLFDDVTAGNKEALPAFIDLKKATSSFTHGTYRLVPGAGHLIPQEKPRESLEIIREFFEGIH